MKCGSAVFSSSIDLCSHSAQPDRRAETACGENAPGLPLHYGPAERVSERQEEDAELSRYYQQALGSLLWLVTYSRPDMVWAYSIPSNVTTRCPKGSHSGYDTPASKSPRENVLPHLRRSAPGLMDPIHMCCRCHPCTGRLCVAQRQHGFCPRILGDIAIENQTIVTTSTAASELVEALNADLQAPNVALVMAEMNQSVLTFALACDATASPSMVGERAQMVWRTRHTSVRGLLLYQVALDAEVRLHYVARAGQRADGLTKGVAHESFMHWPVRHGAWQRLCEGAARRAAHLPLCVH